MRRYRDTRAGDTQVPGSEEPETATEWVGGARNRETGGGTQIPGKGSVLDSVIVALDLDDEESALDVARAVKGRVKWVKVGMTLFYATGPKIVRELRSMGFKVFVDLKLHDIPHQVEGACRTLTRIGADMFTVHASGGSAMLAAAVSATEAAARRFGTARPSVLAVSVLTSLDDAALAEMGVASTAAEQVERLVDLAGAAGCDGVVCSPLEAPNVRQILGPEALIVTPGIRLPGGLPGDQARTATPGEAIAAGATHLVIGRPVTAAADPVEALESIAKELEAHDAQ